MDDLEHELGEHHVVVEDDNNSSDNSTKGPKKNKLPLAKCLGVETPYENGFHKSTRICLEHIRDAMLHHRWQEAAVYMAHYPQVLEDTRQYPSPQYIKELIWRLSTEILHHHPNSKMEDYNLIYERMKQTGFKNYLMLSLEHSFHLLLHGHLEDVKHQLAVSESWRYGKESSAQVQGIKLIQAYRALVDYIRWCDKKFTRSSAETDDQELDNYSRQACVNFEEILKNPGVWDPFILSYIEMLEFYEMDKEALEVLNDYAYDKSFPPNPNAHVYLYQYLKRHKSPQKKLRTVLKVLKDLVPSHELMLEYSALLLQSEKQKAHIKALGVVLEMLDFACWRSSLDVWKCLKTIIQKLQLKKDWRTVVQDQISGRKDFWPALHFTRLHASKDSEIPELMEVKSSLAKVLCPDLDLKYGAAGSSCEEET